MLKKIFFGCLLLLASLQLRAQTCTFPGQTPVSAVFVCSSETFTITTPTYCGQTNIPTPCADGAVYQNLNPNFFRFGCYTAGTLGFTISPDDATANYNWQLFDVTNTNPVDIFTNANLFVACNWSSDPGETGASSDGTSTMVCTGIGLPLFSKMPNLLAGHSYILMVTNHSGTTQSYQLNFGGGTATITDAIEPHMQVASLSCDRTQLSIRLNKQVKCNTLAIDGTDFTVSGGVNVIGAAPFDCSTPFGTGIVTLFLDQPLGFGNYTVTIGNGSDGNTLVDICTRSIPAGETLSFISAPQQFTPMDELNNDECKPGYIELIFRKPILCSSIAADGSDFIFTGPQAVTAIPSLPACTNNSTTSVIRLNFTTAVVTGNYQVQLATGTDGNTILNECLVPTPAGAALPFFVSEGVSALFTQSNATACSQQTVSFWHDGNNNTTSWNWNFGNGTSSNLQNPVVNFAAGQYTVRLIVTNGICTDTSFQQVQINSQFNAAFNAPDIICPGDILELENTSTGSIDRWQWSFGNGAASSQQTPAGIQYLENGRENWYTIRLIASNTTLGCNDTATHVVKVLNNCFIAVPSAFTPNGDGKNDFLYPLNAVKANNLEFKVYNRMGQLVFITKDWTKKWDGKINGLLQDTGIYAWLLSYTHADTGEIVFQKGTTLLLR
ncbi:MAG: gliding motility-associated C-terminal domain-containing protein [Chitinophagaceae bacterium]|nr:gliding motility-associated C-terminal domain-containing protein [Chitinophagaceae bacterium]